MSLNLNELQQEHQRMQEQASAGFLENFVKMPEGNGHVVLRLLPPAASGLFGRDKSPFYQATRIHKVNNKSVHCPKVLEGGKWKGSCPVCDYYNWLWRESEKKSPEEANRMQAQARSIKPIERYYYNAIVRQQYNEATGEMEKNVGPRIFSVGKTIHKMIIRAIVGDEALDEKPLGDVTDPKKGRDFKLIKTMRQSGTENYPNYDTSKFLDASALGEPDQVEEWLKTVHDITSLRIIRDLEELKHELKVHLGIVEDTSTGGFDPTEFQKPAENSKATATVTVVNTKTGDAVSEEVNLESDDVGDSVDNTDQAVPDDEFLRELREMG